jgi:hypothetical protein
MELGALSVRLGANTSDLTRGLNQAKSSLNGFESSVGSLSGVLKGLFAALSVQQFTVFIKGTINAADEIGKLSQKLGVGTEELSKLQYAADLAGVSSGELTASLSRLTKGMSDAANGTGDALRGFQALGIQVKAADGSLRSSSDIMGDVADAFARMEDGANKTALAINLFGRSGANLIPLLNGGRQAIKEAGDELAQFGGVITPDAARKAEIFNDNLTRLQTAVKGVGMAIANDMLPFLTRLSNEFLVAEKNSLSFFDKLQLGLRSPFKNYQQLISDIDRELADLGDSTSLRFDAEKAASLQRQRNYYAEMAQIQALAGANEEYTDFISRRLMPKPETKTAGPSLVDPKLAEAERKQLEDRIKVIQESLMTESQLAQAKYDRDLKSLEEANAKGIRIEGGYNKAIQDLQTAHQQKMWEIEATSPEAMAAQKAAKRQIEYENQLRDKLTALQNSLLSEEDLQMQKFAKEIEILNQSLANKYLTEEEWNKMFQELEQRHWDTIYGIRNRGMSDIVRVAEMWRKKDYQGALQGFAMMTAASANASKEMFNLNKAASLASAVVKAYESITSAYAWGNKFGGPPLGAAFAAAASAFSFAQVRAIASQQFSGASGSAGAPAPSAVGGITPGGTPGAAGAAFGGDQVVNISLQGEIFNREQVRDLIGQINEAISDGAVLRLA